jgi:hypothetical protein
MSQSFNGGLVIPWKISGQGPWIRLNMSSSYLEFEMRFRLLRRFFGPWRMDHSTVREVYLSKPKALDPSFRVNFLGEENLPWAFLTQHPYEVLECARQLGYPVRPEGPVG